MKKKITIFTLFAVMCTCFFNSFGVYAADSCYGTVLKKDSDNVFTFKQYDLNEESDTYGKVDYSVTYHATIVESSADIYCIGFLGDENDSDPMFCMYVLMYSTKSFVVNERKNNDITTFDRYSRYDSDSGFYYYKFGYSGGNRANTGNGCPMYRKEIKDANVKIYLEQLKNGTFEQDNDDGYIDGSENPEFDPDIAEYVKDIGYLQNVSKGYRVVSSADGVSADFQEVKYIYKWGEKTNTNFDVTQDNVYVSFYHQIIGYKQNLPFGSKQEVVGKKVFIDKVKGSDLQLIAFQTDINSKCAEDLSKLDYTPLLQTISRTDADWLRIEVYHPDTGTYTYGGWVKIAGEEGNEDAETTTWEPDPDGGNDDVQDPDGGVGDGEETPGDYGGGETMDEADDNAKPIEPSGDFSFTDFVSILDSLADGIGKFPQLVAKVFSFLPSAFIGMLVAGLTVVVICRIMGR